MQIGAPWPAAGLLPQNDVLMPSATISGRPPASWEGKGPQRANLSKLLERKWPLSLQSSRTKLNSSARFRLTALVRGTYAPDHPLGGLPKRWGRSLKEISEANITRQRHAGLELYKNEKHIPEMRLLRDPDHLHMFGLGVLSDR